MQMAPRDLPKETAKLQTEKDAFADITGKKYIQKRIFAWQDFKISISLNKI